MLKIILSIIFIFKIGFWEGLVSDGLRERISTVVADLSNLFHVAETVGSVRIRIFPEWGIHFLEKGSILN